MSLKNKRTCNFVIKNKAKSTWPTLCEYGVVQHRTPTINPFTMKLTTYNRPFPNNFFRFFDDDVTKANHSYRPAVNIAESDEAFELALLAPGRSKDNFTIAFNEGVLEVSYTSEKTGNETTPNYRRQEFQLADFNRKFKLDDSVINDEAIDASYLDGVLRLTLPKREEALPKVPRQIAVG